MPSQYEPPKPNIFQHFLRGVDAAKSTLLASLATKPADSMDRKQTLIYAGTMQLSLAAFTTAAIIGRIHQEPGRLKTNSLGIVLRTGIILMDAASGALLLLDPEEQTYSSSIGKSLLACSIFVSRLVAEDGHHDEPTLNADDESKQDVENPTDKTSLLNKSSYGSTS